MDRLIVTNPMVGICRMQLCVEKEVTNAEALAFANRESPSGTTHGWGRVCDDTDEPKGDCQPKPCSDHPETRLHLLLEC